MPGRLFIISAPSGAGKTTISRRLRKMALAQVSVSHTTRPPRASEKNGEQYYFVDRAAFAKMRDAGAFLEWATVFEHWYGTSKEWVTRQLQKGENVLLEIDWQGAKRVKEQLPDAVSIFIRPPSLQTLRERLLKRGEDSPRAMENRLLGAQDDLARMDDFDYVIINDDLDAAVHRIRAVIAP